MSTIELPDELDRRLDAFAKASGRDKAAMVRQALADWLDEQEDWRVAEARIGEPRVTLERLRRETLQTTPLHGAHRGGVKIAPGVDLTAPTLDGCDARADWPHDRTRS